MIVDKKVIRCRRFLFFFSDDNHRIRTIEISRGKKPSRQICKVCVAYQYIFTVDHTLQQQQPAIRIRNL